MPVQVVCNACGSQISARGACAPLRLTAQQVLASFAGDIEPVPTSLSYRFGLGLFMLLLPGIYVGMIAGVVWLVWLHVVNSVAIAGAGFWGLVAYLAPIVMGAIFIFFMVKPLFAQSSERRSAIRSAGRGFDLILLLRIPSG